MLALTGVSVGSDVIRMERFDGIEAIQSHINLRKQVESFVHGKSREKPDFFERRCRQCDVRRWLHGVSGGQCSNRDLVGELHTSCREFQNAARSAVEMAAAGQQYVAHSLISDEGSFRHASDRHQSTLAQLHISCELI